MSTTTVMTPAELVRIIRADWQNPNYAAVPYLDALEGVTTWNCTVEFESARSLAPYLLNNLRTYRGETARFVKAQLKAVAL